MQKLDVKVDFNSDCRVFSIQDSSIYHNVNLVENLIVEIKPPGVDCFTSFEWVPGFNFVLNCSTLNLCCVDCPNEFSLLPDGNYEIKISIDPNLKTITEYNHFRVCQLFKKYISQVCQLYKDKSDMKKNEFENKLDSLYRIKEIIMSSKYSAEECLDIQSALELYKDAEEKLNILSNGKGCATC
jgi:hypothetical protein